MNSYDNFFLPIDDMEAAKRYYGDTLGLKLKFDFADKGMTAYSVGEEEPAIVLKDINKFSEVKPTIWFMVDDVYKAYEILKRKGVKFISEPFRIYTGTAVEFDDPFGNRLGITDYNKLS
ncbi:MAG: VOC family protein [Candidatus Ornithomonoglobus sp.]